MHKFFLNLRVWLSYGYTPLVILGILFAILNLTLFLQLGIKEVDDSPRYLIYAQEMRERGFYFDPHNFWYIAYPVFIIIVRSIHDSLEAVIITQYLLSFTALICFYFTALKLSEQKVSAFFSTLLYVIFFEISIYNSYILCESFFVSLTCMALFVLTRWYQKGITWINLLIGIPVLILTIFSKPTGIALLGAIFFVLLYIFMKRIRSTGKRFALGIILLIPFVVLVNKMLTTFGFINDYRTGEIIFGVTNFMDQSFYQTLTISRPDPLYFPDENYPPLARLLLFILHHPVYWSKLFFLKLFYFFAHIRPFWALWHNIYSLLVLIPIYTLSISNIIKKSIPFPIKLFSVSYIAIHALSVGLLTDDWDGRFLLPILPIVFLWSGYELDLFVKQKIYVKKMQSDLTC